jgi:hypothetical protein
MITDTEILNAILNERDQIRNEIAISQKTMNQSLLLFISILPIIGGLMFKKDIPIENNGDFFFLLIIALIQIEIFLSIFILSLYSIQNIHAYYIELLETKINNLAQKTITAWESVVCNQYLIKLNPHSLAHTFLAILAFLSLVLLVSLNIKDIFAKGYSYYFLATLCVEIIGIVILFVLIKNERKKFFSFMDKKLFD